MHESVMEWVGARVQSPQHRDAKPVLEIGSYNVNGSVRDLFSPLVSYVGVDVIEGPGVDMVVPSRARLPFHDDHFGLVVSTECLEHAEWPWQVVYEMGRVARSGAPIFITARGWRCTDLSTGEVICFGYHNPPDRWRFSGDAMAAMAEAAGLVVDEVTPDPQVAGWFLAASKP